MTTKWVCIHRGKAGWCADGLACWTKGGRPNKVSSSGGTMEGYAAEAEDGTIVYDAYEADSGAFITWVFRGPMLDPALKPGTDNRFTKEDAKTAIHMLPGMSGAFVGIAALASVDACTKDNTSSPDYTKREYGSGDFVALDIYLALLRAKVPGVRFGKVINHQVVWND
jgi:hypothetical protein